MAVLLQLMSYRFLWIFVATLIFMFSVMANVATQQNKKKDPPAPVKRSIMVVIGPLVLILAILNLLFGSSLSSWVIYKHGETGSGVVLNQQETGDLYNEEPVIGYEVLLKKADGQTVETYFESWDFNLYPSPKGPYHYPAPGVEFAVKYLPQSPDLFVILSNKPSEYSEAANCQNLKAIMEEAERKMNFAQDNETYRAEYEAALELYEKSCQNESPSESADIPEEWQLYWNDTHDFAFSMPEYWQIDKERTSENSIVFSDPTRSGGESREAVNIESNPDQLSFDEFVNAFIAQRNYSEEQVNRNYSVQIGEGPTVFIDSHEFGIKLYLFEHNGQIFRIESQTLFNDEVLKTFNFDGSLGEKCATKHLNETGEVYYSIYDNCYWENHTPIDFLNGLKSHPEAELTFFEAPQDWITKENVAQLMPLIDSTEPAGPVFSSLSSSRPDKPSTVGNEAMFLIEGYRKGVYPPEHSSIVYGENEELNKEELKQWWAEQNN